MAARKPRLRPEQIQAAIARLEAQAKFDPVRVYKPGPTCARCAASPKYFRLLNGANQTGKTNHAVWETAAMARGIHPHKAWYGPVKILVVVPSRQQAVMVWGHRLLTRCEMPGEIGQHPYIPAQEVKKVWYNYSGAGKAPGRIELVNGSEIIFAWSGDAKMWERIQGMMVDYIVRDEAVGSDKLSPELVMRLVTKRSTTPWGGGCLWVGTPTLENEEYDEYQKRCREGKPDYEEFFIHASENPAVSMSVRESVRDTMSDEEAAVRIDGGTSAGAVLRIYRNHWKDERHLANVDYEPGDSDNLWISFDPGIGHPAGILCAAIAPDTPTLLRVVRFYCHRNQSLEYHVRCMSEWLDGRALEGLVVDPKAFTRESSGKSIVTQIEEMMGQPDPPLRSHRGIIKGRNGHWETINQVMEWLSPVTGNDLAPSRILCNRDTPGMGLFRWQMLEYKGREATKYTGPHGVVKKKDEGPDCLRYLVSVDPTYEPRGPNPRRGRVLRPATPEGLEAADAARLSPELLRHRELLRISAQRIEQMQREDRGGASSWLDGDVADHAMAVERLDW